VLAYSTIANLGLIISSAGIGSSLAISAAIMLLIFHAISKALLFLCAGQIEHIIGSRDIEDMTGLIRKAPVITSILVLGILSMILPPFGVLITKWVSMEASASNPAVIVMLVLGSALTSVYYLKWLGTVLSYPVSDLTPENKKKFVTYFPLLSLGAGIIATSIFITPIFNYFVSPEVTGLLNVKNQLAGTYIKVYSDVESFNDGLVFLVLLTTLVIYLFVRKFILSTNIKTVYLCGENSSPENSKIRFRAGDGTAVKPVVSNLYLLNVISENTVTNAGYIVSIITILVVIAGGLL
jgi:ech hydrogenase subunit A